MAILEVSLIPEFKGSDVVLLAMDGAALRLMRDAFAEAIANQRVIEVIGHLAVRILNEPGAAALELSDHSLLFRLSTSKILEIDEQLAALASLEGPCHQYVDIVAPTETLVLSKDEYLTPPKSVLVI